MTLKAALLENVDLSAMLITDELAAYRKAGKAFAAGHQTVKHGSREYVLEDVHSNTIEGLFSLLKRGMHGAFHSVSKKHLHRYLAEFAFRYNSRKIEDADRVSRVIRAANGKRLTYADQVAGA